MASTATLTDSDLLKSIERIQGIKLDDGSSYTVVDCELALSDMIDTLADLPVTPPSIYVDLEGINLSRQGTISILQLYVLPKDYTYLVDVHQLRHAAFSTTGKHSGKCLKAILEAEDIPKVFFDVRNDSDALFHHFQISLSGVHDIQLMEVATRKFNRRCVNGLQRCIEHDAVMTAAERRAWNAAKEEGKKLFAPERGGRYEVFNDRPLAKEIIQYCVQDVQFLPQLWSHYQGRLSASWLTKVQVATVERVSLSQSKHYNGHGKHKAMAPAGWYTAPSNSARQNRGWGTWNDDY
jgi:exonuclease 3'-5' domain-containing protein 1